MDIPPRISGIFNQARVITDPTEREAFLEEATSGDQELLEGVKGLLEAHIRINEDPGRPLASLPDLDRFLKEAVEVHEREVPGPFGRYHLLEIIGEGGMGVVYRARQEGLEREVALKIIRRGKLADRRSLQRFLAEARLAASLTHPHLVPVYDFGVVDDAYYYTMELIAGANLGERCGQGPLPPKEAISAMLKVGEAVVYAHRKGVIHRDLKPENVLLADGLDTSGLKITDFGLAIDAGRTSRLTVVGEILGTPGFMAPEQFSGVNSAPAETNDVWSLGALLYFALTAKSPFLGSTLDEQLFATARGQMVPLKHYWAKAPKELQDLCRRCLRPDPKQRVASAQEFVDCLGACEVEEEKKPLWLRRAVIVGMVLMALALSIAIKQEKRTEDAGKAATRPVVATARDEHLVRRIQVVGPVSSFAVSGSGASIAVVSDRKPQEVTVIKSGSRGVEKRVLETEFPIRWSCLNPVQAGVLVGGDEKTVLYKKGRVVGEYPAAFSPGGFDLMGETLWLPQESGLALVDVRSRALKEEIGFDAPIFAAQWCAEAGLVFLLSDDGVARWIEPGSGAEYDRKETKISRGLVSVSPDGTMIATVDPHQEKVAFWRREETEAPEVVLVPEFGAVSSLTWGPESRRVYLSGSRGKVVVIPLEGERVPKVLFQVGREVLTIKCAGELLWLNQEGAGGVEVWDPKGER